MGKTVMPIIMGLYNDYLASWKNTGKDVILYKLTTAFDSLQVMRTCQLDHHKGI